jgi:predicted GNAT family acetyltransferase
MNNGTIITTFDMSISRPLETFQNAQQFLDRAQTTLVAKEAINSLLLGTCLQLVRHPERLTDTPYFATIGKGVLVDLAAMITPPYNLVLASDLFDAKPALEIIADDLIEKDWEVRGVTATKSLALSFAELWTGKTGSGYALEMALRVYECRAVIPPASIPGELHQATLDELEMVTQWTFAFMEETFPHQVLEPQAIQALVRSRVEDGEIFLWHHDLPVSMAASTRPTMNGISINYVYTPDQYRHNGYASACVADLTQTLFSSGYKFCSLNTDLANPTSNSIYKKIGYNPIQDMISYLFEYKPLLT